MVSVMIEGDEYYIVANCRCTEIISMKRREEP